MKKLKTVFRYPGGKSKIADNIINDVVPFSPSVFVDVFTGGGSVSIEMLNRKQNAKIVLNDLDPYIYSFWKILTGPKEDINKLLNIIEQYNEPTIQKFQELREISKSTTNLEMKAYIALFFNRTAFSGIIRSGPIGGYNQTGKYKINCRFNKSKIISGIKNISEELKKNNAECYSDDFRDIIKKYSDKEDAFLYLDPPYMKQGHQLYGVFMNDNDYIDMSNLLKSAKCKWMVSHDDYEPFVKLFDWANISDTNSVPYTINSIKGNRKTELLISNFDFQFNRNIV